jgi:hypothetical protein
MRSPSREILCSAPAWTQSAAGSTAVERSLTRAAGSFSYCRLPQCLASLIPDQHDWPYQDCSESYRALKTAMNHAYLRLLGRLKMTHTFDALTVEKAAEAYVLSRSKGRFMSMAQAIRALRTLMPDCMAADHELERLLAKTCDVHRVPVAFDVARASGSKTLRA